MNYEEMSDFELNKLVAFAIDDDGDIESVTQRESKLNCIGNQALVKIKGIVGAEPFNPCNNPSDAWSIIVENGISLVWMDAKVTYYEAHGINQDRADEDWHSQHPNPLRAAMICFLKMKDEEK